MILKNDDEDNSKETKNSKKYLFQRLNNKAYLLFFTKICHFQKLDKLWHIINFVKIYIFLECQNWLSKIRTLDITSLLSNSDKSLSFLKICWGIFLKVKQILIVN